VWLQVLALTWWSVPLLSWRSDLPAGAGLLAVVGACWVVLCRFLLLGSRIAHAVALVTALQWVAHAAALQGSPTAIGAYLLLGPVALVLLCVPPSRRHCWERVPAPAPAGLLPGVAKIETPLR
jgi:hypothetical protein